MRKNKIIHILPHSPSPNSSKDISDATLPDNYIKVNYAPFWLGFFDVDWHVQIANQVKSRFPSFDIECWRPYKIADKIYSKTINSIKHKIFPSSDFGFGSLKIRDTSAQLISELKKECKDNNVIISLFGIHNELSISIPLEFPKNRILGVHLGGLLDQYHFQNRNNFIERLMYFPRYLRSQKSYQNMSKIFACTKMEYLYLKKYNNQTQLFHPIGIDSKEVIFDKLDFRKKLGIKPHQKVLLHVGRFQKFRGVLNNLAIFRKLKKKHDVVLIVVGGYKSDPLYTKCLESGAIVIERVPKDELLKYYQISDIYLDHITDKELLLGGGIGMAAAEAITLGIPLVGTNLIHFEGDINLVGHIPKDIDDSVTIVCNYFDNFNSKKSQKISNLSDFYSWDRISQRFISQYTQWSSID